MNTPLSPDEVCEKFADSGTKLTIKLLGDEHILIEGSAMALEFVARLFQAQATFSKDCGFSISPTGAGNALFSKSSTFGIYIHRLPCMEPSNHPSDVDT
jgi:hypothetical protein